jgi:hypothetical protein
MNEPRRLTREDGQGIVSALLLLAGVLLPLMFLVTLFGRIEQARLAADQTAQDAVRAASLAPSQIAAEQAVQAAAAQAQTQTGLPLQATLEGSLERGATLTAIATVQVPLGSIPFLGTFGTLTINGQAQAPVDEYRSLDPDASQ